MKKLLVCLLVLAMVCPALVGAASEPEKKLSGTLTIYTALPDGEWPYYINAFQKETGVTVNCLRLSAGEMVTRVVAEKENPQASVMFGGSSDNYIAARQNDVLAAYQTAELADVPKEYLDAQGVYNPIYVGAIGFACNTEIFADKGWSYPESWEDLLKPEFKGEIVMAHPTTSGTAYTVFAALFQLMGEEKAWAYMKQLDEQLLHYTKAGSAAPSQVGLGEAAIAITFAHDALQYTTEDAGEWPIIVTFPKEGTGFEVGACALIKNGIKGEEENAKYFIDWCVSKHGQDLYAESQSFRIPINTTAAVDKNITPISQLAIIDYDAVWAGENKARLLEEFKTNIDNAENLYVVK